MTSLAGIVFTTDGPIVFTLLEQGNRIWDNRQLEDALLVELVTTQTTPHPIASPTPRRLLPSANIEKQNSEVRIQNRNERRQPASTDFLFFLSFCSPVLLASDSWLLFSCISQSIRCLRKAWWAAKRAMAKPARPSRKPPLRIKLRMKAAGRQWRCGAAMCGDPARTSAGRRAARSARRSCDGDGRRRGRCSAEGRLERVDRAPSSHLHRFVYVSALASARALCRKRRS